MSGLERLLDRYVVESYLANRAGGWFYRVRLREDGQRRFVLRVFSPALGRKNERAFTGTADPAVGLEHPALSKLWELGEYPDPVKRQQLYYCVEDDYDPEHLLVAQEVKKAEPLPVATLHRVATGLANALAYLERSGRNHGDIKPGNVLLGPDGRAALVHPVLAKLTCIPRERAAEEDKATVADLCRAPEATETGPVASIAADIHALGAVLFFLATGALPRSGSKSRDDPALGAPDPVKLRPELGPDFAAVLVMSLQRDPARRQPSADALAAELRRIARGEPSTGARRRSEQIAGSQRMRQGPAGERRMLGRPLAWLVGIGAVLLVAAVLALSVLVDGGGTGPELSQPDVAEQVRVPPSDPVVVQTPPAPVPPQDPPPTGPAPHDPPALLPAPPVTSTDPPPLPADPPPVVVELPPVVADPPPAGPVLPLAARVLPPPEAEAVAEDVWRVRFRADDCLVDGLRYSPTAEAEAMGLSVVAAGSLVSRESALPLPDLGEESKLLRQGLATTGDRMGVRVPVPDGHYAVSLWHAETRNKNSGYVVRIESAERSPLSGGDFGALERGQARRYDFAPVACTDGALTVEIQRRQTNGEPTLFALRVRRMAPAASPVAADHYVDWSWSATAWRATAGGTLPWWSVPATGPGLPLAIQVQIPQPDGAIRALHRPVLAEEHPLDDGAWWVQGEDMAVRMAPTDAGWRLILPAERKAQVVLRAPRTGRYRLLRSTATGGSIERIHVGGRTVEAVAAATELVLGQVLADQPIILHLAPATTMQELILDWELLRLADPRPSPLTIAIDAGEVAQRRRGATFQVEVPLNIVHPDGQPVRLASASLRIGGEDPVPAAITNGKAIVTWKEAPEGIHQLVADLVDADGAVARSAPVRLVVGEPPLPAVLVVSKNGPNEAEQAALTGLNLHGNLQVRAVRTADLTAAVLDQAHIILISHNADMRELRMPLPQLFARPVPMVTWQKWMFPHLQLCGKSEHLDYGEQGGQQKLSPPRGGAPIGIFTTTGTVTWAKPAGRTRNLLGARNEAVVSLLAAGEVGDGVDPAPAARLGIGFLTEPAKVSPEGWRIVRQALDAALGRGDQR